MTNRPSLTPAEHLRDLADLATPFALRAVASARIPELIAGGTCEVGALAAASGTSPDVLGRMLRYLAHRGVFTEPAPGMFALTETGRLLADPAPTSLQAWLDLAGPAARPDLAYAGLLHSLRTGEAAYTAVHGRTFWEDIDAEPGYQEFWDAVMTAGHRRLGPQIAALYDWSATRTLVDVGGGSGALLHELLRVHPHLRAILVDRPAPAQATARRLAAAGLNGRVRVEPGDFFARLPAGGDVYLISRALSDWDDPQAVAILRNCGAAAAPSGRVLVVEVLPTDPFVPHQSRFDLQMLAVVGGRERSPEEFAALARAAGLAVTRILPGREGLILIECAVAPSGDVEADSRC